MEEKINKVFGIGFHKTGTTSLGRALELLGYRVQGPFGITDPDIGEKALDRALELAEQYDAFQDFPWAVLYKELDQAYPNSKFILTVRPTDDWIDSVARHFGYRTNPIRTWIYGVGYPKGHEDVYIERYEKHNREVLDYFEDRPDDLLVLRVTEGEGWEKLCPFLGKDLPETNFPKANTTKQRRVKRVRRYLDHPVESIKKLVRSYKRSFWS